MHYWQNLNLPVCYVMLESHHNDLYSVRFISYAFIIVYCAMHSLLFDDTNVISSLFLNRTFLPCALLKGGTTIAVMYVCTFNTVY